MEDPLAQRGALVGTGVVDGEEGPAVVVERDEAAARLERPASARRELPAFGDLDPATHAGLLYHSASSRRRNSRPALGFTRSMRRLTLLPGGSPDSDGIR